MHSRRYALYRVHRRDNFAYRYGQDIYVATILFFFDIKWNIAFVEYAEI